MAPHGDQFATLIESVRARGTYSYRELAERAHKAGHEISHQQLASYAHSGAAKFPTADQLRAVAAALDVSFIEVEKAAFLEWMDYMPEILSNIDGGTTGNIVLIPAGLTSAERRELQRLIDAWVAAHGPDVEN